MSYRHGNFLTDSIKLSLFTCLASMLLTIVPMRRDAEKLKFFSFAASLKKLVADDVGKNAYHIWFAAAGRQEKRDKCE